MQRAYGTYAITTIANAEMTHNYQSVPKYHRILALEIMTIA
jgi:hypothetical protein